MKLPFSGIDVLLVLGTATGAFGFYLIWPPLAPLFLGAVCLFLANLAWRAAP